MKDWSLSSKLSKLLSCQVMWSYQLIDKDSITDIPYSNTNSFDLMTQWLAPICECTNSGCGWPVRAVRCKIILSRSLLSSHYHNLSSSTPIRPNTKPFKSICAIKLLASDLASSLLDSHRHRCKKKRLRSHCIDIASSCTVRARAVDTLFTRYSERCVYMSALWVSNCNERRLRFLLLLVS